MSEKEPNRVYDEPKNTSLERVKIIAEAIVKTIHKPAETKELIKAEVRRVRRLMRHKFYY